MKRLYILTLLISALLVGSCNLILGPNERWGFDYDDIHLYHRMKLGGMWVYYLQNDGRSARIAFVNKFDDMWIEEGWEGEKYSYEIGWVKYHIAIVRSDHIRIGFKKP